MSELLSGKEEDPGKELPSGLESHKMLPGNDEKLLTDGSKPRKLTSEEKKDIRENTQYAVISYLYVLSVIVWLAHRDSMFASFHAKQGTVILVLATLFLFAPAVIMVPVELALLTAILAGVFQARNGVYYRIPVIYDLMPGKLSDEVLPPCTSTLREFWEDVKKRIGEEKKKRSMLDTARKRENG